MQHKKLLAIAVVGAGVYAFARRDRIGNLIGAAVYSVRSYMHMRHLLGDMEADSKVRQDVIPEMDAAAQAPPKGAS